MTKRPDLPASGIKSRIIPRPAEPRPAPRTTATGSKAATATTTAPSKPVTSLAEAAATLQAVVPGFIALRVFYWIAYPTKRTDLELVLWSLLWSVPLWGVAAWFVHPPADNSIPGWTIATAWAIAAGGGAIAAGVWRMLAKRWESLRLQASSTVWDSIVTPPRGGYLQVEMLDGTRILGWIGSAAYSVQAEDPDVYIREPAYLDSNDREIDLPRVDGILIARSNVARLIRFIPAVPPDPSRSHAGGDDSA